MRLKKIVRIELAFNSVYARVSFFSIISTFFKSRSRKCPSLSLLIIHFHQKIFLQNLNKKKKRRHFVDEIQLCTLMADSVQWRSQSDYSICISIQVEFYKYSLFTMVWVDLQLIMHENIKNNTQLLCKPSFTVRYYGLSQCHCISLV